LFYSGKIKKMIRFDPLEVKKYLVLREEHQNDQGTDHEVYWQTTMGAVTLAKEDSRIYGHGGESAVTGTAKGRAWLSFKHVRTQLKRRLIASCEEMACKSPPGLRFQAYWHSPPDSTRRAS